MTLLDNWEYPGTSRLHLRGSAVAMLPHAVTAPDLESFVKQYNEAINQFFHGDPEPAKKLYSRRENASLANPFGPVAIGWENIEPTMERAAAHYHDGRATGFETLTSYATPELAHIVGIESFEAKIGSREDAISGSLRVTSVLCVEDGAWKILHRHADPITAPRSPESVFQN